MYFYMFVTKATNPPLNWYCGCCAADMPHEGQHAGQGSLKVPKMEFFIKLIFEV